VDVPWSTCATPHTRGILELPNPSQTSDVSYAVSISLLTSQTAPSQKMTFQLASDRWYSSDGAAAIGEAYGDVVVSGAGTLRFTSTALGMADTITVTEGRNHFTLHHRKSPPGGDYIVNVASFDSKGVPGQTSTLHIIIPTPPGALTVNPMKTSVVEGTSQITLNVTASVANTLIVRAPTLGTSQVFILNAGTTAINVILLSKAPVGTHTLVLTQTSSSGQPSSPVNVDVTVTGRPQAPQIALVNAAPITVTYSNSMSISLPLTSSGPGYVWANVTGVLAQVKTVVAGVNQWTFSLPPIMKPGTYTIVVTSYLNAYTSGVPVKVQLTVRS
ncbi:MAG: hypothetical protein QOE91_1386, partial [Gaiellaceae bacterium]|nr:hypothetical protein [Gaiellaceae bacterium]